MKKKTCQNKHARKRAAQRFGLTMGPKTHDVLVKRIQDGEAIFVEKQSNRISLWDCEHEGQVIRLVYDRNRKQIVTFLYPDRQDDRLFPVQIKVCQPASSPVRLPESSNITLDGRVMCPSEIEKRDATLARLDVPKHLQQRYIDIIKSKRAKFVNRQNKSVSMYEIEDGDGTFWVMYHTSHGYITNVVRLKERVLKLV